MSGCEMVSSHPQCGCIEFIDSGWKKLSCGLALERPAEWLQLGCSIRGRKKKQKTQKKQCAPETDHIVIILALDGLENGCQKSC